MSSRAIKPKRDDTLLTNWQSVPERPPSEMRPDRPVVARVLALIGLFLLVLGALAVVAPALGRQPLIGPGWGLFLATIGVYLIVLHAFAERDLQFRRLYAILGLGLVGLGAIARVLPAPGEQPIGALFVPAGVPALILGLAFLLAVLRAETETFWRQLLLGVLAGAGGLMIVLGLGAGLALPDYLAGEGLVLLVLGLLFVVGFIVMQEPTSEAGYYAGLALGAVGLIGLAVGLLRSFWPESTYLVPAGLIVIGVSLVYLAVAAAVCTDWPVVVIARRELAAYFYSPIAYLVFIGMLLVGWFMFFNFVDQLLEYGNRGVMFEPIIGRYVFGLFPAIVQIFVVPVVTMRLLAEEKRSGTLEVLLTAPVGEWSVVLGKFLAAWIFYMLLWVPWWLFLVALRYMAPVEFDYRPMLSFMVALGCMNAGVLAMGLFFSSVTSNQIIAAVFTFVGMIAHLAFYFLSFSREVGQGSALSELFIYVNMFDLWFNSLRGLVAPRYLLFHVSAAVFFLYLTVQVLASRKWK